MEKLWLNQYEHGVPHEINPDSYNSLIDLIEEKYQEYNNKIAYSNMGHGITYSELNILSTAFAAYLQNTLKLKVGDRVAIMMPNVLQYPVALFGILRAGLTVVNVNPLYTPTELKHILQDSGVKAILVLSNFANTVQKVLPAIPDLIVIVTSIGDLFPFIKKNIINFVVKYIKKKVPDWNIPGHIDFNALIEKGKQLNYYKPVINNQHIAFLQYTGGTTGVSKGAMLTHRNMLANLMQAKAWVSPILQSKKIQAGGIITALPLYHIFSLTANCLTFFTFGICNILITNPKDIPGFIKELKRQPFIAMTGVNTLFNALLHHPKFSTVDFSHLILALGGGMATQKPVAMRWKQLTGSPIVEAYGLTEASPAVTINPLNTEVFSGSIGLPLPSTNIKICDETGQELPLGEIGELYIQGPQVMAGYWNTPETTDQQLLKSGWLKSGDLAYVNDKGFVYIVDRKKDMINVSGFNVYPNEVEDVIMHLAGVKEVAVIGISDETHGEIVKAFVVRDKTVNPPITAEAVIAHAHESLTGYKVPKLIEFKEELPKTNVGKVLRRALREH